MRLEPKVMDELSLAYYLGWKLPENSVAENHTRIGQAHLLTAIFNENMSVQARIV